MMKFNLPGRNTSRLPNKALFSLCFAVFSLYLLLLRTREAEAMAEAEEGAGATGKRKRNQG